MWYHKNTTFEKNCQYLYEIFIKLPIEANAETGEKCAPTRSRLKAIMPGGFRH